ncbi:hypothetical protein QCA50_017293 [Cerrena zonata]|uniref:Uncharacterized protein n=1 Tax=Cerrena zonata TaxID=2478898 RepID=A0AAW0FDD0_9APHY
MIPLISSNTRFAEQRRKEARLVDKLVAIGTQAKIEVPRIVAIGNQGAGKSSLVGTISGIQVLRDARTSTRAPIECRFSCSDQPWRCNVYTCATLGALRRAQHWVLNPNSQLEDVRDMTLDHLIQDHDNELPFSQNIICLDISGPDLVDLSFVDPPGFVQDADPELVQLIESLVLSYINGNRPILVTIPMCDAMAAPLVNQSAVRLARKVDPHGTRTIGVLTKPDVVGLTLGTTKEQDMQLDVIEGRKHPLKHGYYCIRQPDQKERTRGVTREEMRLIEETFFLQTIHWSTSSHRHRFGTKHLIDDLSTLLSRMIDAHISKFEMEITARLSQCEARLVALPSPPMNPYIFTLDCITSFCSDVRSHVVGIPKKGDLAQLNIKTYEQYRVEIYATRPLFLPFEDQSRAELWRHLLSTWYDEYKADGFIELGRAGEIYLNEVRKTIECSRELPGFVSYSAAKTLMQKFQRDWGNITLKCFNSVHNTLRECIEALIFQYFPHHPNLGNEIRHAVVELIASQREDALKLINMMVQFESVPYTQNSGSLRDTVHDWLAKSREIQKRSRQTMTSTRDYKFDRTKLKRSNRGVGGASQQLIVVNTANSTTSAPQGTSSEDDQKCEENNAVAVPDRPGHHNLSAEDLTQPAPHDDYEEELKLMADVQAFFRVSYQRIIDNIPMAIDHGFLTPFSHKLQTFLIEKLELSGEKAAERCANYATQDARTTAQREELLAQKTRLENTRRELLNFAS